MKPKFKQISAIIGIVALLSLYVISFIVACLDFPSKQVFFIACICATVFLPIFLWIFIWMFGVLTKKKTIASFRSSEMDETMKLAEQIKYNNNLSSDQNEGCAIPKEKED